ncbi:hypothetical protein RQP46_011180 [Phenoliferia psychrophenolica]
MLVVAASHLHFFQRCLVISNGIGRKIELRHLGEQQPLALPVPHHGDLECRSFFRIFRFNVQQQLERRVVHFLPDFHNSLHRSFFFHFQLGGFDGQRQHVLGTINLYVGRHRFIVFMGVGFDIKLCAVVFTASQLHFRLIVIILHAVDGQQRIAGARLDILFTIVIIVVEGLFRSAELDDYDYGIPLSLCLFIATGVRKP